MKPWREMTITEWMLFMDQNDLAIVRVQKNGVNRVRLNPATGEPKLIEATTFELRRRTTGDMLDACETFYEAADAAQENAERLKVN